MKVANDLYELCYMPEPLVINFISMMRACCNEIQTKQDKESFFEYMRDFGTAFGGPLKLIEYENELHEIKTLKGRSVVEIADSFDVCEWISPDYLLIVLMTNDAGGTSYYVPKALVNDNLRQSVSLTSTMWEGRLC
jgi:hypothetical protein